MVRRRDEKGGYYHEPPYTPEEEAEFYRRMGSGLASFTRPARSPAPKASPPPESPQE